MATDYYAGVGPGFYDLFSTGLPGDVGFYVAQAQAAGSPVLELGLWHGPRDDLHRGSGSTGAGA